MKFVNDENRKNVEEMFEASEKMDLIEIGVNYNLEEFEARTHLDVAVGANSLIAEVGEDLFTPEDLKKIDNKIQELCQLVGQAFDNAKQKDPALLVQFFKANDFLKLFKEMDDLEDEMLDHIFMGSMAGDEVKDQIDELVKNAPDELKREYIEDHDCEDCEDKDDCELYQSFQEPKQPFDTEHIVNRNLIKLLATEHSDDFIVSAAYPHELIVYDLDINKMHELIDALNDHGFEVDPTETMHSAAENKSIIIIH